MDIYFSHPTFTYQTRTERDCVEIIKKAFDVDEIINPADFGLRKDTRDLIKKADMVVGMAVSQRFTFLVWNEMEIGKMSGAETSTFVVESKNDLGPLVKGIPDGIKKLDYDESRIFREKILDEEKETIFSIIFGNWGRRF
ncbi:MAG: hypothetical protein R6U61_06245 [Thermoplasmata archaeon]